MTQAKESGKEILGEGGLKPAANQREERKEG
jgi:hypothetical protein